MNDRLNRGVVSLALAVLMLVVGSMAQKVFPPETQYVGYLFLFGASVFLADAAVTMTRINPREEEADDRRDRAAAPWRVAFGLAFVLTLVAAARTGSSFVTVTAMLMSMVAAGVYLVRRRFFGNLRDVFTAPRNDGAAKLSAAFKTRDHAALAALIEQRIELERDPGRRNALLLTLGAVHVVRGAYDEALRAFERLDRRVRSEKGADGKWMDMGFVVDLNLASAYLAKGDFESAESCLSRIDGTTLPSEFALAWNVNRSSLLVGKGDHAAAIRFVESLEVEKMEPSARMPFLRDLAESLAASGADTERAMRVAEQCIALDEGPQALNVMAFVLLAEKKFELAREKLVSALERNPDGRTNLRVFAESHYYLGLALKGLGKIDDAIAEFRRAADVKGGGRFALAASKESAA